MQQRRKNLERRQERAIQEKEKLLRDVEEEQPLKILPLTHWKKELIRVQDLRLSYQPGEEAGSDLSARKKGQGLSFVLEQGQRIALTGGNGSGKSSVIREILKTAAQEAQASFKEAQADGPERGAGGLIRLSGELSLPSDLKISYVPQDASFLRGDLTAFAREQEVDRSLFLTVLRKLDIPRELFHKPMEQYSEG